MCRCFSAIAVKSFLHFALQAILLWLRVTPAEVTIDLGSHISLPQGRKIPIRADGTLLISPNAGKKARRLTLNELLLATQQRDAGKTTRSLKRCATRSCWRERRPIRFHRRMFLPPPWPPFKRTAYLRRISWIFDCVILLLAAVVSGKTSPYFPGQSGAGRDRVHARRIA